MCINEEILAGTLLGFSIYIALEQYSFITIKIFSKGYGQYKELLGNFTGWAVWYKNKMLCLTLHCPIAQTNIKHKGKFLVYNCHWPFLVYNCHWPFLVYNCHWPFLVYNCHWPFLVYNCHWPFLVYNCHWPL